MFHMIPPITFIGSWFVLANSLGLFNSYSALIIAHATINLPLGLFIITNYMKEIPREIQEAAVMDGASNHQPILEFFFHCYCLVYLQQPSLSFYSVGMTSWYRSTSLQRQHRLFQFQ